MSIIDDEKMLADSTAEYFNLFGVKTAIAYSASDCRDFFRENSAELLLLDINLGDGSGFELCKELRETTEIPILFLSGIGIVKCTFAIPVGFIIAAGIGLVLFAFLTLCLLSLKIRKITPTSLLTGE